MTILFLHGLGQTPAAWEGVIDTLPPEVRCLCPDLTAWPASYSGLCRQLEDCCGQLREPFHLCGLSLGGVLALRYAIDHPEALRSLTLIGAQYRTPGALLRLQNALFRLMPAAAFRSSGFSKGDLLGLSRSLLELDLGDGLGRISCPTLVLCGARDRANRAAAREMAERIPRSRLVLLPGVGHEVNREAPAALSAELRSFMGI